jgi:hypothetical protein
MAYGFDGRLFLEHGPAIHAERARFARSTQTARVWRSLNEAGRLELVERTLEKAANDDMPDGLPVAL